MLSVPSVVELLATDFLFQLFHRCPFRGNNGCRTSPIYSVPAVPQGIPGHRQMVEGSWTIMCALCMKKIFIHSLHRKLGISAAVSQAVVFLSSPGKLPFGWLSVKGLSCCSPPGNCHSSGSQSSGCFSLSAPQEKLPFELLSLK
ncbi:hypothetical protein GDO78_005096 [Eleutherodactylus coqui]|uniref:Uncharacterized protein n=1 Tax=Eleutherodactylus coqui TaxID=57060 RepID=A0A8J6FJG6_ELECQ|nr:hypothetical protein GDO78_005096 [Eleutherodactylus coqui]